MASGWWDNNGAISGCVAAYQPIGAASLAASYTNKANPGTYDAAPGVAPTFAAATGWAFNGSTQYLTTGIVPSARTWTYIIRFSDGIPVTTFDYMFGRVSGSGYVIFGASEGTNHSYYLANTSRVTGSRVLSGVMAMAGNACYLNGASDGAMAGSTWTTGTLGLYIGGVNGLSSGNWLNCKIQAVAIYNTTLTAGEVATLTTAMNALPVASGSALPLFAAQIAVMS